MKPGDWVGLPSKIKRVIHFGEIIGPYEFDEKQEPRLPHYRSVKWFALDIPRSSFLQDVLYSFGPPTICGIKAEERIRAMAKNAKKRGQVQLVTVAGKKEHTEQLDLSPLLSFCVDMPPIRLARMEAQDRRATCEACLHTTPSALCGW